MTTSDYKPFLESGRIFLRPLEEADVDKDYGCWLNDPEVCAHNSHAVFPVSRENLIDFVRKSAGSRSEVVLAIICKENGRHIGNISLQGIHWINRSADLAILIGAKDCWGKGYGVEAAGLMVSYGFERLGLHRITCGTFAGNTGMKKIALKLGFAEEGCRRQAAFNKGAFVDILEFGLLAGEFRKPE